MTSCWLWTKSTNRNGYGRILKREGRKVRTLLVHRLVYTAVVGPIPKGAVLDHLCRNRRCANPAHLEPVSVRTNTLRGDGPTARRFRAKRGLDTYARTGR